MKILIINTNDNFGGAARAAKRIFLGLKSAGHEVLFLTQNKIGNDNGVIEPKTLNDRIFSKFRPYIDKLPVYFYVKRKQGKFTNAFISKSIIKKIKRINPDVVNLHWTASGFVSVEALRLIKKPIIWTLHDSWAFTGGCHIPQDCKRYLDTCGCCPQLASKRENDLSRWNWKRKKKSWSDLSFIIVTPSKWLAKCARSSSLFHNKKIEVIPNSIDTSVFRPISKIRARDKLKLSQNKKLVLFGAMNVKGDLNKGYHLLKESLKILEEKKKKYDVEYLIFGNKDKIHESFLATKTHGLGLIKDDEQLALIYSAADVTVVPSMQENLPCVIMESMSCGTPCVAFNVGGISDLIDHPRNGFLAKPYDTGKVAEGIDLIISKSLADKELSFNARKKVENNFDQKVITSRYVNIYENAIKIHK